MVKFNRRRLLSSLGLLAGVSGLGLNPLTTTAYAKPSTATGATSLNGTIYIVGENATLLPEAQGLKKEDCCVISTLDIATGEKKYAIVPVPNGHVAIHSGNGNILVVGHHGNRNAFVDKDLNILKVIEAPKGYLYSGHGMYDAKRDRTIVPLRHIEAKSVKDTGLFEVYNSTTLELVKTVTSGGLHPHEPKLIPGTDEIACTHYGEIYVENPPFIMNVVEPKLTILDAETLEIKRHYVQQDYAMLTHMDIDDKGQAYCVMTQALRINKNHPDGWEAAVSVADKQMQQLLNFKRDFPLPYRIADRSRIDIPLPMIQIDTQTGERKDYFTGFANQMRGQSVAKNSMAGIAAGVFYHSDTLITHKADANQLLATKAADLGLADIRGICELEGTPYIALAGSNRGVIIIDARNFEVVRRYSIDTHENVHLSARIV